MVSGEGLLGCSAVIGWPGKDIDTHPLQTHTFLPLWQQLCAECNSLKGGGREELWYVPAAPWDSLVQ